VSSAGPGVKVDGDEVLASTLRTAGRQLSDWAAVNAAAATRIAADAARRAPKRSGRLSGSIRSQSDNTGAQITASVVYAKVQEYGWAQHNIAAQPYLRPALDDNRADVLAMYEAKMKDAVSQVKGA
jgi:HK97 gp10 family phage protein